MTTMTNSQMMEGWCDPYHQDGQRFPHTWHHYAQPFLDTPSSCGKWGYEPDADHPLHSTPPNGAKICRTCLRAVRSRIAAG